MIPVTPLVRPETEYMITTLELVRFARLTASLVRSVLTVPHVVAHLLRLGATTARIYGTLHVEGTLELVQPSSGGACALGDTLCSAAEDAQPEQPEAPQAPEVPQAPSAPSGPKYVGTLR